MSRVGLTIDLGQHKDKNNYYHSFKIRLRGQPRVWPGSKVGLTIDLGQHKDTSCYYCSFKTRLEGKPRARLGSWVEYIVDLCQYKDKIDYYHSFKHDSGIDLRQGSGHGSGWPLIFLKPDLRVKSMKGSCHDSEGQPSLTWVNVWIKMIIIIVLKFDSGVNLEQGLGNGPKCFF